MPPPPPRGGMNKKNARELLWSLDSELRRAADAGESTTVVECPSSSPSPLEDSEYAANAATRARGCECQNLRGMNAASRSQGGVKPGPFCLVRPWRWTFAYHSVVGDRTVGVLGYVRLMGVVT